MKAVEIDLIGHIGTMIAEIARNFPEIERITMFGSRVLGKAKKGSDIDLTVVGKMVAPQAMSAFSDYLNEKTNMLFFFDIIHFEPIENEALRQPIVHYGKTLFEKKLKRYECYPDRKPLERIPVRRHRSWYFDARFTILVG